MSQIYVHIGWPKTASTMLQRSLFEVHPDIYPVTSKSSPEAQYFLNSLLLDSTEYSSKETKKLFDQLTQYENIKNKSIVISCENLTEPYADRGLIAERLNALSKDLRILGMIRNQHTAIPALYGSRNIQRMVTLDEWLEIVGSFVLPAFNYDPVIKKYEELFGTDNLGLFVYEDMKKDPEEYIRRICDFVGIDAQKSIELSSGRHDNKRISQRAYRYARIRRVFLNKIHFRKILPNTIFEAGVNFINRGTPLSDRLSVDWSKRITDLYADSNLKLMNRFSLDLHNYDYPSR